MIAILACESSRRALRGDYSDDRKRGSVPVARTTRIKRTSTVHSSVLKTTKMAEIIIGRASEHDPAALHLYTKGNRRFIENELPDSDLSRDALRAAREIVRGISPSAMCRSLTGLYNCVGLVFASRRTMVDVKHLPIILEDDGYSMIPESDALLGDIVLYRRNGLISHVGIVFEFRDVSIRGDRSRIEVWVLSQWGENGEYLHKLREVPTIYGDGLEFWSERRPEC